MTDLVQARTGACPFAGSTMPKDGTPFRPSPQFANWRSEAPATRLRAENGDLGWFVTGFDLAQKILSDPRFSAAHPRYPLGLGHSLVDGADVPTEDAVAARCAGNVLSLDPPQHTRIRRAVTRRFSVRAVRAQLPLISEFIARQLDNLLSRESADLFTDLALPVSVLAHCQVLGIPESHRQRFAEIFATDDLRHNAMFAFTQELLDVKRDDLGEDTVSDLLRSELTRAEVEGITAVLLASGRDAIAYMISTNMASLLLAPDQLHRLVEEPALIPVAVEEFVRFNSMFLSTHPRTVATSGTIDGIDFVEGESVWISTVAANRDPNRFEDPDSFDVTRDAYGHIAFGHGIHSCIGQQLARAVIAETITQLLRRAPSLHLIEAQQTEVLPFAGHLPTYSPGRVVVGW